MGHKVHRAHFIAVQIHGGRADHTAALDGGRNALRQVEGVGDDIVCVAIAADRCGSIQLHCRFGAALGQRHGGDLGLGIHQRTVRKALKGPVEQIIEELKQELDAEGIAYDKDIQVGVMMETAAASLIADILAKEADFFSIGTNDLTGYTMAADRGNPDVAYLYSAYNPAVLRSIRNIISAANKEDIMAGMCGEAAHSSSV